MNFKRKKKNLKYAWRPDCPFGCKTCGIRTTRTGNSYGKYRRQDVRRIEASKSED